MILLQGNTSSGLAKSNHELTFNQKFRFKFGSNKQENPRLLMLLLEKHSELIQDLQKPITFPVFSLKYYLQNHKLIGFSTFELVDNRGNINFIKDHSVEVSMKNQQRVAAIRFTMRQTSSDIFKMRNNNQLQPQVLERVMDNGRQLLRRMESPEPILAPHLLRQDIRLR